MSAYKPPIHSIAIVPAFLFLITGFLGGYTIFLSYTVETLRLFSAGQLKQALLNLYEAAYTAAPNPNRGKVDLLKKNETRKSLFFLARFVVFPSGFPCYCFSFVHG